MGIGRIRNIDLIDKPEKEVKLIPETENEYVTADGELYKYLPHKNKFFKRKTGINHTQYVYCNVQFKKDSKIRTACVHRLVALAWIVNEHPDKYDVVGHKNNIKHDNRVENLYWTDTSENTKKCYDDGFKQSSGLDSCFTKPYYVIYNEKLYVITGSRKLKKFITDIKNKLKANGIKRQFRTNKYLFNIIPISSLSTIETHINVNGVEYNVIKALETQGLSYEKLKLKHKQLLTTYTHDKVCIPKHKRV